ncbi:MAG: bifunctional farnesyl-diphosphate farnesyltransferase/squalene synthase [Candelina submexicana]|nr:MAG: bifunctional farnesyl-diphosphate farnesyltransferase/squalene synthase [Candelina submexicana]
MPSASDVVYYLIHLQELRSIIQWKVWHAPVHERNEDKESITLRKCFDLLQMTSRSFSGVIQELHPELLVPVALFYLAERGQDTIEDDMTISLEEKEPLLRNFHNILEKEGWTYDRNGPNEKDRELLVKFDIVIEELMKIKPAYRAIIKDITQKMGNGMADFAANAEYNANGVNTVKDYELYCHYVAGLVGEGLTRLFVESGLANPALLERPHLQESMGQFLQKTNIIRDVREDLDDKRRFWPKEIWSKHVNRFEDLFDPKNQAAALNCSSEMVLNALKHADECLFYLAGIKEQSVFNFAAIPQSMAIATLELVFRNPQVFRRNIKITKGQACRLMLQSSQNLQTVCDVFRTYIRKIHQKNSPKDPSFLQISIACGKVEQFIESIFPSQNPRAMVQQQEPAAVAALDAQVAPADPTKEAEARSEMIYLMLACFGTVVFISTIMIGVAWLLGARFDVAIHQLKQGSARIPVPEKAAQAVSRYDHGEL